MKRKIVQFRYFEDGKGQLNYTPIQYRENKSLVENLHIENKLYSKANGVYEVVPANVAIDTSDDETATTYYYRIQQLMIH